jgi:transcriptional regulator with XRE-family HTH domain
MKLYEKIIKLRKSNGWSQEELAEKLDLSRQAISRWENGTALPDANNILQLSKIFGVTSDYLLNEDYSDDGDIPCVKEAKKELDSKKDSNRKLFIVSSVAFLLGAVVWLVQAINHLSAPYAVLAIVNALLSGVSVIILDRNKR